MPNIQLIYASLATSDTHSRNTTALAHSAAERNERIGVTGLLILVGRLFLQVLEGDRGTVNRLYDRIAADPRHSDVTLIAYAAIHERHFSRWSMHVVCWDGTPTPEQRACLRRHFGTEQIETQATSPRQALAFLREVAAREGAAAFTSGDCSSARVKGVSECRMHCTESHNTIPECPNAGPG